MDINPQQFQGMLASVIESQPAEVTVGKQPVLAEHGSAVRAMLGALPPEASAALTGAYQEPAPALLGAMAGALGSRGQAYDNAAQERGLDQNWLAQGGAGRTINETGLSAGDDWNATPVPAPAQ